ncbi:MAG: hypothetical protein RIG62_03685 [Cyclobacteriaceae bacterium]
MKIFFHLLAILLLSGCTIGYQLYDTSNEMLVDFPLPAHTQDVPIYFPGDTLPTQEYVRVGVLEARGSEHTTYNDLIRVIQYKGQHAGVDAIQILDKQSFVDECEYCLYDDDEVTTVLSGLGIKYLDSLEYLSAYAKAKEIFVLNSGTSSSDPWAAKLWMDFNGSTQREEGDEYYAELIKKTSLDYLLHEESRQWRYANDPQGNVRMRVRSIQAVPQRRVWFTYKYQGFPSTARIRDYPSKAETLIQFEYDGYGHIMEKMIYLPDDTVLKEIPSYDADGKQVGSAFFTVAPGQPDQPYLRVVHYFYSPEDVEDRIVLK